METTAMSRGKTVRTRDVKRKKPSQTLAVPLRNLEEGEALACGFRQNLFELGEKDDGGGVDTGTGLGTDFIILRWKGKWALVRGLDLLKSWVETFCSEDAARFPEDQ